MQPFDLGPLITPALAIFFLTLWVAFRVTRSLGFALSAAFVKAGIFLVYFGMLFDGTFTFLDDWRYLYGGEVLYARDVGIINLADNLPVTIRIAGGSHFVYYLYNTYAFRLFNEYYFAPVALNILLTLLVAWFGTLLATREFGLSGIWRKLFFAFLLLHPDILAWSSIMNGKDILVLLMHVLLLLSVSLFLRRRWVTAFALGVPVSLLLFFTRFYVPLLFVLALFLSLLFGGSKGYLRLTLLASVLLVLVFVGFEYGGWIQYALSVLRENFVNPVYGMMRFVLTPVPFHIEDNYAFLNIPAVIHWLLFPFACYGIIVVHRLSTPFSRYFLFYLLVFVSLYGLYGEFQGPRHRVQIDYAWAVLQFMGVMAFGRSLLARVRQAMIPPLAATVPPETST